MQFFYNGVWKLVTNYIKKIPPKKIKIDDFMAITAGLKLLINNSENDL